MADEARNDVPLGRRMPHAKTRVVVADRNVITRVGIRAILERTSGTAVIAEATNYEAVLDAVEQLRATEVERARAVWRKKFDRPSTDPNDRAKQMRFLLTRGFSADVVRKIVQGAGSDDD